MNNTSACDVLTEIPNVGKPLVSIVMFLLGVLGNLLALVILGVHRKELRAKSSVFLILVTGLVVTDLLGTCFLSPIVFVEYAKKKSMIGLVGGRTLCNLFSTAMIFFGLAPTLILCAMAVERCLAISYPYYYSQHVNRTYAKTVLPATYIFSFLFCILPMLDFGEHKQYCPGTWCFVDMKSKYPSGVAFSLLYASLIAFLIVAILLCNASVIVSLCKMHKGQRSRRGSVLSSQKRRKSVFGQREEEVDHLILLALMTTIFGICSLPLTDWRGRNPTGDESEACRIGRRRRLGRVLGLKPRCRLVQEQNRGRCAPPGQCGAASRLGSVLSATLETLCTLVGRQTLLWSIVD
ncbi:prostacyclin receptor isoform X2 [Mobula birostris]|uniref:prostacyclin receptor isoform X2 n=1 Tax=Mobula birostris TaxID=1983395 RepID=UPI003B27BDE8